MNNGSTPPSAAWNPPKVDVSAVRERLTREFGDVVLLGQKAFEEGRKYDYWLFQNYATALIGVLTDEWALMTLALWESET